MSPGVWPTPGNRPNRFSGIVQPFLGQMGSDFEKILYMCNIGLDRGGCHKSYANIEKNTTRFGRDSRTGQTGATCAIREWV